MSLIGMTGVEPDDSVAPRCRRKASEMRSPAVSWSEVAIAWAMAAVGLAGLAAVCLVVTAVA
jgi:hypothetical protein